MRRGVLDERASSPGPLRPAGPPRGAAVRLTNTRPLPRVCVPQIPSPDFLSTCSSDWQSVSDHSRSLGVSPKEGNSHRAPQVRPGAAAAPAAARPSLALAVPQPGSPPAASPAPPARRGGTVCSYNSFSLAEQEAPSSSRRPPAASAVSLP